MWRYVTTRFFNGMLVVFLISLATFVVMRLLPGDPVYVLMGEGQVQLSQEQIDAIRSAWGLDLPWSQQYLRWVGNMLSGKMGESIIRIGVPVREMILEAAPVTVRLNLYALVISLLIAIPAGVLAGVKRNSFFDYVATIGSTLGVALPNFWVGLMAIVVFSLTLGWLPPFGLRSWKGYILPVAVLATEQAAVIARVMRSCMIEVLGADYVRTARAKGLSERAVIFVHAVRNALLPVVGIIGYQVSYILSGTIVVETVFALPGIGRLLADSVFRLDYQVVQSIVFLLSAVVATMNVLTDIVYAIVDPRIRLE